MKETIYAGLLAILLAPAMAVAQEQRHLRPGTERPRARGEDLGRTGNEDRA